eukprot:TRINITY_DN110879_c0_g1_i1.p1 TRINITY_DN110879_c0_g1~~TRINITY_DN110879_c0_g1_i1.p1  ORF type:complete len:445 (+),score=112.29 TRINITY_DN110879_c0_g1_i1:63-1397(+)
MGWNDWQDKGSWNNWQDKGSSSSSWNDRSGWGGKEENDGQDYNKRRSDGNWDSSSSKYAKTEDGHQSSYGQQATQSPGGMTPGFAVPQTPMAAFGQSAPRTPAAAFAPSGVGMSAPSTPGYNIPATPANRYPGGTPGMAAPSTPAGAFAAPMTAGAAPMTAGYRPQPMTRGMQYNGLSTPVAAPRGAPGTPMVPGTVYRRPSTFSDGSVCTLRHAPRRKKGTGERLPAPGTPAIIPAHWNNPAAGEPAKPPPKDPIPDFKRWQEERTKALAITSGPNKGLKPANDTDTPVPTLPEPGTPGLPSLQVKAQEFFGAETPLLQGGITPVMGGMTPMLPAAGRGGEMTPFLGETPRQYGGEETPQVAFNPGPNAKVPAGSLYGEMTPVGGAVTPRLATKQETQWLTKQEGSSTPGGMTPQFQVGATPLMGLSGEVTPMLPGAMTPALP